LRWRRFVLFGTLLLAGACAPAPPKPDLSGPHSIFAPGFEAGANLHSHPQLELLRAMGATWVRLNLDWEGIQPRPEVWDFSQADASIAAAESAGLKVYACLLYSPPWASSNGRSNGVPRAAAWEAYVSAVARRYGQRVQAYGIWNEPNLDDYWAGNARDYVQVLLLPASAIIHREAPGVLVAGPDLAHLVTATIPVPQFFRELKLYGGIGALDVVSHHVYGQEDLEGKMVGAKFLGLTYRPGLKDMLGQAGLAGKPLWLTETGVNAKDVGEERQAQLLDLQWRFFATQPWVKKAFIYAWADDAGQRSEWGLLDRKGRPKPAYRALERLLTGNSTLFIQ
jgi:hypothetical protein